MNAPPHAGPSLEVGEAQFRAILDAIPARVALLDRDRRHCYVNREYATFVARRPEEVVGLTVPELFGPETYARLAHIYARLRPCSEKALAGEPARWEGWMEDTVRGAPCFVQRYYMPYRGPSGSVDGYFVFTRDLTALKQSEQQLATQLEALRRSEALNAAITASALDGVIVIDEDGLVVEFNPAAEHSFGHARADAIGRPVADLIVPPALRARHAEGLRRYLASGESRMLGRRVELEAMRADGSIFPIEIAITEVRLPGRRLFTAYLRDLTEAHAAAAQIQRQREALQQSEKLAAFGSLLAGVAHELNNPLSIVLGSALILQEQVEAEYPAIAERAERIRVAADRCARIVRSFLAMARQQAAVRRPLEATRVIDDALQLLAYQLRSSGITVERDVPPGLPPLLGDADQLQQVMANLLTNARQALEQRAVPRCLRVSARAAGGAIEITIADNGPGIPAEVRGRIFDPFFTTKPVGAGTGIGLAVSRGIAEAHGGSLHLGEAPEGGACFVLRLPQAPAAEAPATEGTARRGEAGAAQPARSALIVDDEPDLAGMLADILRPLGFRCDLAATGAEAQRLLESRDYDVILCDLRMPDLDGGAFYAWLERARPQLCRRTAFVTGDTLGHAAGGVLALAGRPVLEKPFLPETVRRLVLAMPAG
jgi:two-component system NtrC family sensor kinase